ncbi:MAG: PAS domain S-box protein [Candidatus Magnetoovum sp. WYHC-5]|nr:PAS domain S-box protein [Candidatus Magnetoovum sp. WYHC-5]
MIHEEDRSSLLKHLSDILEGKNTSSIEHRIIHKDGRIRWVRNTPALHYNDQGTLTSYDGLIIDITEAKEAEEALRKYGKELELCVRQRTTELIDAKNYLESVLASIIDALFVADCRAVTKTVNDSACKLTGYTQTELIGLSLNTVLFCNKNSNFASITELIINENIINNQEGILIDKKGANIPVTISGSVMSLNSIEKPNIVFVVRDMSDRKIAEKKLYTSYQFQNALNRLLQVSINEKCLYEQLQEALDVIVSAPFMETIPKGIIFLIDENTNQLAIYVSKGISESIMDKCGFVPIGRCICGRAASSGEIEFASQIDERHEIQYDGIAPHGHYCVPIISMGKVLGVIALYIKENHPKDKREEEFLTAVSNTLATIIERKASEEERQKIQTKMLATSKMATLGEIATGIAHEINQPLTYISSVLQGLKRDIKYNTIDVDELKTEIDTSYEQVKRITNIIQHLRTFGRCDDIIMENANIATALENTLLLMGERIHLRNIKLIKNIQKDLPLINGSQTQLEQVFINIFQNSVDAFPDKTKDATIVVDISLNNKKDAIIIKLSDNGPGINSVYIDKIFEPFFTTKDVGKGTGLGLAIVYGIVTQHGGTIQCDSILNKGTTFTIVLPA